VTTRRPGPPSAADFDRIVRFRRFLATARTGPIGRAGGLVRSVPQVAPEAQPSDREDPDDDDS